MERKNNNKVMILKKIIFALVTIVLIVGMNSCSPVNQPEVIYVHDTIIIEPIVEDSYYVKYSYSQRTNYSSPGWVNVSYTRADGTISASETSSGSNTFIVGPVKKGFKAHINVAFNGYMGNIMCSISVSKNDGDYVLKKYHQSPDNSMSGSASFTVGE